jgi:uncharacterized protein (TIGR04255 family)
MATRYQRPPLIEARCEIHLAGGEWDDTTPERIHGALRDRFPRRVNTEPGETRARLILSRHDDVQTAQFFPDRLVVTQLRPYPGFQAWRPLVLELLELHQKLIGSTRMERVLLRYVNRLALPDPHADVTAYLNVESSHANGFRRRIELEPIHHSHRLVATAGSTHGGDAPGAALLDICDAHDGAAEIERVLDEAHQNVEGAFERLVTDRARRSFGEMRA